MPQVMIGVPVFNGASLLRESLTCLQNQSHDDFGVTIHDNASTDGSTQIAAEFAATDSRFKLVTWPETIPAWDNYRRALKFADSAYFAWRAHDDLSAPNYIETLVARLKAQPSAVLAASQIRTFKLSSGKERVFPTPILSNAPQTARLQLLRHVHAGWFYGLYRRQALEPLFDRAFTQFPHDWAGDHAVLYPMLISQKIALSNDTWFIQRSSLNTMRGRRDKSSSAIERQIFFDYIKYGNDCIDEAGFDMADLIVLKAHLPLDAHRRAYRIGHLLRRMVTG